MLRYRSPEQIGRTDLGARPLPPLGRPQAARRAPTVDTVLDSGLRVIAVRRPTMPVVELRLSVPFAGSHRTHPARAEVLSATLLRGTQRRDRLRVDTDLATVGGQLDVGVDPERLTVSGNALASGLAVLLDVLADALTAATHRAAEVTRERSRLAERIAIARSQPRVIAREALQHRRYGNHPFTREVPHAEEVLAVGPTAVRGLHHRALVPHNSVLVLVGDLTPARAVDAVAAALEGWTAEQPATELPPLPAVTGDDLLLVHRPEAVQSQLRISAQAVPRTDERYPALRLANLIFGGYFSSRWVENLREDKGYTYAAHSRFEFTPHGATLLADADTASDVTAAAVLETRYELGRMTVVPPGPADVEAARQYALGSLMITTSAQAGLAGTLATLASVGLGPDWLREHPGRLQAVTPEQVAAAAATFFRPTAFTGVVVGDAEQLASPLQALGGVELP